MACYSRWTRFIGGEKKLVACNRCIGCRLDYAGKWAARIMNEASLYDHNEYITLTYADEHLPQYNELAYEDFQKFMRRLRKHMARNDPKSKTEPTKCTPPCPGGATKNRGKIFPEKPKQIRFYMSGEYGDKEGRPHFHAILFNLRFADREYLKQSPSGEPLYTSQQLDRLWGKGFCSLGAVTQKSANYVARYVMKKIGNKQTEKHYLLTDTETGEIREKKREFSNMSRRPGIGMPWIKKYLSDVYPDGMMVVNGWPVRPPTAYDRYYKLKNPKKYREMINQRGKEALTRTLTEDNQRIQAKETVKRAQLAQLKRKL